MNLECPIQSVDWQAGPPPCSPPFPCEVQLWTEVLGKICILEAFLSYTCPTPPLSHGKRLTRVSRIFPKFHRCIMCGGSEQIKFVRTQYSQPYRSTVKADALKSGNFCWSDAGDFQTRSNFQTALHVFHFR